MDRNMELRLQKYIEDESHDVALYQELARVAPNETDRRLLVGISQDEQSHADAFNKIYKSMTGKSHKVVVPPIILKGSFVNILKDRAIDESGDFRKYSEQYALTEPKTPLKSAYYKALTDENVHALRILTMLS